MGNDCSSQIIVHRRCCWSKLVDPLTCYSYRGESYIAMALCPLLTILHENNEMIVPEPKRITLPVGFCFLQNADHCPLCPIAAQKWRAVWGSSVAATVTSQNNSSCQ